MWRIAAAVAALVVAAGAVLAVHLVLRPGVQPAFAITATPTVPPLKVSAQIAKPAPGEAFAVDIDANAVGQAPGELVVAARYPARLLVLTGCAPAGGFECEVQSPGVVRFHGVRDTTGSFQLGTLEFQAPDYACLTWVRLTLERGTGATNDGSVLIYADAVDPSGDVTCDGIDAVDALLILQIAAFLIGVGDVPYWPNADVDGNGEYNAIDAALVLQKTAGLL